MVGLVGLQPDTGSFGGEWEARAQVGGVQSPLHHSLLGVTTLLQGLGAAAIPGSGAAPRRGPGQRPGKIFWAFFKAFPDHF